MIGGQGTHHPPPLIWNCHKYFDDEIAFLSVEKIRLLPITPSNVEKKANFVGNCFTNQVKNPQYICICQEIIFVDWLFWTGKYVKLETVKFHTAPLHEIENGGSSPMDENGVSWESKLGYLCERRIIPLHYTAEWYHLPPNWPSAANGVSWR